MTTTGTAPGAPRFITGTTTIEAETRAAELTATAARIVPAATKRVGHPARTLASEAANPTVPAQRRALLKETTKQVEDTLNPGSERYALGRLQQLRPWRAGKEFFVTRKCQLRRRRRGAWRRWQALIIEVLSDS